MQLLNSFNHRQAVDVGTANYFFWPHITRAATISHSVNNSIWTWEQGDPVVFVYIIIIIIILIIDIIIIWGGVGVGRSYRLMLKGKCLHRLVNDKFKKSKVFRRLKWGRQTLKCIVININK